MAFHIIIAYKMQKQKIPVYREARLTLNPKYFHSGILFGSKILHHNPFEIITPVLWVR